MGTRNFYGMNASKYYVVGGEDEMEESYIYDIAKENLSSSIKKITEKIDCDFWDRTEYDEWDGDRNYPAQTLQEFSKCFEFYGLEVEVNFTTYMISGYYAGANLDYSIDIQVENTTFDEVEIDTNLSDLEKDLREYADCYFGKTKGLALYHLDGFIQKIMDWVEKLSDEVEKVFSEVTGTELECVATFSDGTALYERVEYRSSLVSFEKVENKEFVYRGYTDLGNVDIDIDENGNIKDVSSVDITDREILEKIKGEFVKWYKSIK